MDHRYAHGPWIRAMDCQRSKLLAGIAASVYTAIYLHSLTVTNVTTVKRLYLLFPSINFELWCQSFHSHGWLTRPILYHMQLCCAKYRIETFLTSCAPVYWRELLNCYVWSVTPPSRRGYGSSPSANRTVDRTMSKQHTSHRSWCSSCTTHELRMQTIFNTIVTQPISKTNTSDTDLKQRFYLTRVAPIRIHGCSESACITTKSHHIINPEAHTINSFNIESCLWIVTGGGITMLPTCDRRWNNHVTNCEANT
jgi:hypothetical protein